MKDYRVDVLFYLYILGRKIVAKTRNHNRDMMLTAALLLILEDKPLSVSEVSDKIGTHLSSTSETLKKLEEDNLIVKTYTKYNRSTLVSLTEKGESRKRHIIEVMQRQCAGLFQELENDEVRQLFHYLKKIQL